MFRSKPNSQPNLLAARMLAIRDAPTPETFVDVTEEKTPRALRQIVYRPAVLVLARGERVPVVVRDLSKSGARVEFFKQTPLTEMVLIDEASLPLRCWARVVWQRDGTSGLWFLR